MSLFTSDDIRVQYVQVDYVGAEGNKKRAEGWVKRIHYPGSMVALEWYDSNNPSGRDRFEIGASRIGSLDRKSEWISIPKGSDPATIYSFDT